MLKVGKVKIDNTHYCGEDIYSDGPIEDEMLDIAKTYSRVNYNEMIANKQNWAILYHFSHIRENIISGLSISPTDSVLEIGAGCGAITGALARKAGKVICVDLSMKRSLINAYRHQEWDNVEIVVGNFKDVEKTLNGKFDVITLIGVFEYAVSYTSGLNPYEDFLHTIKKHLKDDGKIVIAIENKFGLKYWAGAREDHTGLYFEGIEGYKNTSYARTFSRVELKKIFKNVGFEKWKFYYPYPDYKFPLKMFSDDYLPEIGELNMNDYVNFDRERLILFDELATYSNIIQDGMYPYFANSFLAVIGETDNEKMIYSKFSNDRMPKFNIVTEISFEEESKLVRKIPLSIESIPHVESIYSWSKRLGERFEKSGVSVNECRLEGNIAHLAYISGRTFESMLDECMVEGNKEEFYRLLSLYITKIEEVYDGKPFKPCEKFQKVFGMVELDESLKATKDLDIDMIFSNIIEKDGEWVVIDYEWTFDFLIPIKFLFYRAAFSYLIHSPIRKNFCGDDLMKAFAITEPEIEQFKKMEYHFQVNYTLENYEALHLMYHKFGKKCISIADYIGNAEGEENIFERMERLNENYLQEVSENTVQRERANELDHQAKALSDSIIALQNSTSWKITKPLRAVMGLIKNKKFQ